MGAESGKVLVIAARQTDFAELLEDAGFDVDLRTRPLQDVDGTEADLAVVFRGRLIGRNQAAALADQGIPVIEILTVEPPSRSTADWIRLSNREVGPGPDRPGDGRRRAGPKRGHAQERELDPKR
ncbi:MAG: hypothetical protein LC777_19165 [Actinobacteria bacterium]|nr:hypothetical protein [Actinomycetota bacterium]